MSDSYRPQHTSTDKSGTITAGGVAQVLMAANKRRMGFSVQNTSDADLYISDVGTASAGGSSIKLLPSALYENVTGACSLLAISIYGATTGKSFAAREW